LRLDLEQSRVSDLIDRMELGEPDRPLYTEAGLLTGAMFRSLDALHVATALRLDVQVVVTHDHRLQQAARSLGLATAAPASCAD
jgi:hypothetical protein